MVIGIAATAWSTERIVSMRPGDVVHVGGAYFSPARCLSFRVTGPNFQEDVARMTILRGDRAIGQEETSKRFYPARNMPTTQAGLHTVGFSQVYLSFGEPQSDGSLGLRLYFKPLILLDLDRDHLHGARRGYRHDGSSFPGRGACTGQA